jgi:ribonuclease HII
MIFPSFRFETQARAAGAEFVAGCDEVGVAPLAGPVVAAAVVLDPASISGRRTAGKWWHRVRDSKTVNPKERETLAAYIEEHCLAQSVSVVSHETIDELNIYYASMQAMRNAVTSLGLVPDLVFVDGNHKIQDLPKIRQQPVIGGDAQILSIAAASILANVFRDNLLSKLHEQYSVYGFDLNKGYPTKFHREALVKHGPSPVHRRSFNLVRQSLQRHAV